MSKVGKTINLPVITDERGSLVVAEGQSTIPFAIRRVYYMYAVRRARGFHAHRLLQQVAVCLRGTCTFLLDDGSQKSYHRLASPATGLLIDKMIWHEIYDFSDNCLLAVFADSSYDETDYIRDYAEFESLIAAGG